MGLDSDQSPAERLNVEGNDLGRAGRFEEAIMLYTKAIGFDPGYVEPYYNRGKAKLNLRDYQGAVADFNLCLTLRPNHADAYNNRGIARKRAGDLKGAIEDYTTALRLEPTLYRTYLNRGIALFELGDEASACADIRKAAQHGVPEATEALRQAACS